MNTAFPRTSSLAVASLTFGFLAYLLVPGLGALVAVVCGYTARADIRRSPPGSVEGDGMALAGLILGWTQLIIVIAVIGFIMLAVSGGDAFGGLH